MKNVIFWILILCLLSGCGVQETKATEIGINEVSVPEPVYTAYFPDADRIRYSLSADPGEILYQEERIMTNTTEISVKNTGNISFVCHLYYPDGPGDSIGTFTLKPGKKKEFSHLISTEVYGIWFQSDESGIVNTEISG